MDRGKKREEREALRNTIDSQRTSMGAYVQFSYIEVLMDYDDLMSIPFIKDRIKVFNENMNTRNDGRNQDISFSFVCPKLPGRFYYLFGKPIITSGKMELLKDRQTASALHLHVKSEVEHIISYLLKKREEDIYRGIIPRTLYQITWGYNHQVPTFEP